MNVKTSQHTTRFSNKQKLDNLSIFIDEYRRVAQLIVNHIWINGYEWTDKNEVLRFSISDNKLNFPSLMKGDIIDVVGIDTFLSGRSIKCLITQLAGMIKAECEKQRKRLFVLESKKKDGSSKKQRKLLIKKIKQNIPHKPDCSAVNPELNSICCDLKLRQDGEFDGFIRLKSITKTKLDIRIPIKFHRHSKKLSLDRPPMNSFLVSETKIDIRWSKEDTPKKTEGKTVGADQGLKDVLTCSDNQTTPKTCPHGHSLESIILKMSRAKKGSKRFRRLQSHRKNFVNFSLNQINLSGIRQLNLEEIWNITFKSVVSRRLTHWTNTIIRDKVEDLCKTEGVSLVFQSSTYRSQRCSSCGLVRKSNRKGKTYSCECGFEVDADFNASMNHEQVLPEIPYYFRKLNLNRKGFYWLESGLFDLTGTSLQSVPPVE